MKEAHHRPPSPASSESSSSSSSSAPVYRFCKLNAAIRKAIAKHGGAVSPTLSWTTPRVNSLYTVNLCKLNPRRKSGCYLHPPSDVSWPLALHYSSRYLPRHQVYRLHLVRFGSRDRLRGLRRYTGRWGPDRIDFEELCAGLSIERCDVS